jgi:uncharacterized protein (TIGR02646 family)
VRPIVRGAEPASFTAWKAKRSAEWEPDWGNFQGDEKKDVLEALKRDQGFVCCYCEQRLAERTVHIEHLQSRRDAPHLALEFTNLLACCQRDLKVERQAPIHCGHLKGHQSLDVHPLMQDCRAFFIFDSQGGIRPSDEPARSQVARRAIETLGLDVSSLVAQRSQAIDGALTLFEEGASDEEIRQLIAFIESQNAEGHHTPFASAVVQVLTSYVAPAPVS